jgi:MFS family permease
MKKGIKFLLLADALATLGVGMIGPIYAIFVEDIGGDILDASWAYFAFMITSGAVMYLFSKWEDHAKYKEKFVVGGYFIIAAGCLSYLFVNSQFTLLITQVILGLGIAFCSPAFDALYSHYIIKKEETSDWGTWESLAYIVTAIAAVVGGYLASSLGFKTLFVFMFIASLGGAMASLNLFRDKQYLNSK